MDDRICKFGQNVVSKCNCCANPKSETINHVFMEGEVDKNVWKYFGDPIKIKTQATSVRHQMWNWWATNSNNPLHGKFCRVFPMIINWKLWKRRRASRYGQKTYTTYKVISQFFSVVEKSSSPTNQDQRRW